MCKVRDSFFVFKNSALIKQKKKWIERYLSLSSIMRFILFAPLCFHSPDPPTQLFLILGLLWLEEKLVEPVFQLWCCSFLKDTAYLVFFVWKTIHEEGMTSTNRRLIIFWGNPFLTILVGNRWEILFWGYLW